MSENTPSAKQEVLERAIQKAISNGWSCHNLQHYIVDQTSKFVTFDNFDINTKNWGTPVHIILQTEALIFSHDFAKALWGEREFDYQKSDTGTESITIAAPGWQYHLQQMVIAPDPIAYLGENI